MGWWVELGDAVIVNVGPSVVLSRAVIVPRHLAFDGVRMGLWKILNILRTNVCRIIEK